MGHIWWGHVKEGLIVAFLRDSSHHDYFTFTLLHAPALHCWWLTPFQPAAASWTFWQKCWALLPLIATVFPEHFHLFLVWWMSPPPLSASSQADTEKFLYVVRGRSRTCQVTPWLISMLPVTASEPVDILLAAHPDMHIAKSLSLPGKKRVLKLFWSQPKEYTEQSGANWPLAFINSVHESTLWEWTACWVMQRGANATS